MTEILDYAWSKAEAETVRAVFNGGADAHMQRRAIVHIVEMLCGTNRISLSPGSPDLTAFNEGRRWVARQIQNALTLPLDKLVKEEKNEPRPNRLPTATERADSVAAGKPIRPGARTRNPVS